MVIGYDPVAFEATNVDVASVVAVHDWVVVLKALVVQTNSLSVSGAETMSGSEELLVNRTDAAGSVGELLVNELMTGR